MGTVAARIAARQGAIWALTVAMGSFPFTLAAQPVLASSASQSPSAEQLAQGHYRKAYQLASEKLAGERTQAARAGPDVVLDAALAAYAAGQSPVADDLLQELLSQTTTRLAEGIRATALHLRAEVRPPSTTTEERVTDLLEATRLYQATGGTRSVLAESSLAILLSDAAPAVAAPAVKRLKDRLPTASSLPDRERRWLIVSLAQSLNSQGQHEAAEKLLTPVVAELTASVGENNPDTLYAGHELGFALRRQGRLREASARLVPVWEGRKDVLGEEHPLTLKTAILLVRQYRDTRQFDEALSMSRAIEVVVGKTDGADSARHLSTFNAIAEVLLARGDAAEALKVQEPAYVRLTQVAPNGQAVDDAKFTLAQILARLGRYREAEELFEQINARDQRKYPPGHPLRWATLNNIAYIRGEARDYEGQLAVYERLESQMSGEVAATNPGLASVRNNKAAALIALKRNDEAVVVLEQLIATLSGARPAADSQLLRARAQLASAYAAQGEYAKAIALHTQIRDARTAALPPGHPEVANSWYSLGFALEQAGRKQEGLEAYLVAFEMRKQRVGLANPDTIRSVRAAGGVAAELGDYSRAETLYRQGVEGAEGIREYGYFADWMRQSEFAEVVGQYKNYARVLAKLGRWQDAFRIVDLSKARTLREMTYRQVSVISSRLEPKELEQLTALERDIAELSSELALSGRASPQQQAAQTFDSSSSNAVDKLAQQRNSKVQALAQLRTALESKYGWARVDNELTAQTRDAGDFLSPESAFLNLSKLGDSLLVTMLEPDGSVSGGLSDGAIRWDPLESTCRHASLSIL